MKIDLCEDFLKYILFHRQFPNCKSLSRTSFKIDNFFKVDTVFAYVSKIQVDSANQNTQSNCELILKES